MKKPLHMLFSINELLIILGHLSFICSLMAHCVTHCKILFANSGPILVPALTNCDAT
jgi:hypothetical protein